MKINKISNVRFEDERKRGFHILTNDPLSGPKASKTMYNPNTNSKASAWERIVANSQYDSSNLNSRIELIRLAPEWTLKRHGNNLKQSSEV